jgi:predicted dehydrogenase
MEKDKIGFAILGAGMVAKYHAEAISENPEAKLLAVCSRTEKKAKELAEKYSADYYTDYKEMLKRKDIDVVNICTPSGLHAEHGIMAIEAGKNIIVEKPIDISLKKADELIKCGRKNNKKISVVFQSRFFENVIRIKEEIEKGNFGKIILGCANIKWYRHQQYYDTGDWKGTISLDGGGALMNQGIHGVDLLQYFCGEVESIVGYAETLGHKRIEVEDVALAILRFRNGALGTIVASTCCYPGFPTEHHIFAEKGTVIIDQEGRILRWDFLGENKKSEKVVSPLEEKIDRSDPGATLKGKHNPVILDMIKAIKEDKEPKVNGEEGRKSLEIVLAVYKSAKERREIFLPLKEY